MLAAGSLTSILAIGANVSQLVTGLNQAIGIFERFGQVVKGVMDSVVQAAEKGIQAIRNLTQTIASLAGQAAILDSMRDSFNKLTADFGVSGQEFLRILKEQTLGLISEQSLIRSSMTAMMMISKEAMGDITETIPMWAKIAMASARGLGLDIDYAFDSIVRGVARATPKLLDNVGLIMKLGEVYGNFRKEMGITSKELTVVQQQQALINEINRQGARFIEDMGISTGGLTTTMKQLGVTIKDLKNVIGSAFMPIVQALNVHVAELAASIADLLIPQLHLLARVLSEITGFKNPFERWIQGDPIGKTTERIQELYSYLQKLFAQGPDFAGTLTVIMEGFQKELDGINLKFGPRFTKINADLAERVAGIWDSYNRRQARNDEDYQKETERRLETHLERMQELKHRYDVDIADAIRKRDARALLDLMRRQKEEIDSTESKYRTDEVRRKEDRELERARAREDAELREREARAAAAKRWAAVQAEYDKALEKIATARDESLASAETAWENEIKSVEERIEKQKELRATQMEELAKMQEELAQPLPPFWEKFKGILEPVWVKLGEIFELINKIISGEATWGDVLDTLGISSSIDGISTRLGQVWDWLQKIWSFVLTISEAGGIVVRILGPEGVAMFESFRAIVVDLTGSLVIFIPLLEELWTILRPLLKFLITTVGVLLAGALISAITQLRLFLGLLQGMAKQLHTVVDDIVAFYKSVKKIFKGMWKELKGIFTDNSEMMREGFEEWTEAIEEAWDNLWIFIKDLLGGSLDAIIKSFTEFKDSFLGIAQRMSDELIGHSIIPNMLNSIITVFDNFFTNLSQTWYSGWTDLKTVLSTIWDEIIMALWSKLTTISTGLGDWFGGLGGWLGGGREKEEEKKDTGDVSPWLRPWLSSGGSSNTRVSADNWSIYGDRGNGEDVANQVYGILTDLFKAAGVA